jgi:hypothetical protein
MKSEKIKEIKENARAEQNKIFRGDLKPLRSFENSGGGAQRD